MLINSSLRIGILTILLVPILLMAAQAQKFGKITDEEWAQGAPEDYSEATAIVLFDHGEMEITRDAIEFNRHVRMKILTDDGTDQAGEHSIWYHDKYDKVRGFKAHTITQDGKKHRLDQKAIFIKSYGNYRSKDFTFPQLEAGVIIEYKYRILSDRFYNLSPWYFQSDIYTMESRLKVIIAPGFHYNVSYQNIPGPSQQPEIVEKLDVDYSDGLKKKEITWTLNDLPPITNEPYMSCKEDYRSFIKFQLLSYTSPRTGGVYKYVEDWPQLGKERGERFDIYRNKRKQIKQLAEEITAGLVIPLEKSKALYRYVTSNFATSREYNSYFRVNEKLSELLETKQGSEEELNLLLTWLHDEIGMVAFPVLISTRNNGHVVVENPSISQFNHIICYVEIDRGYVLLDAKSDKIPYSILPPSCLVNIGFLIDGDKSQLIKVEIMPATSYRGDVTRIFIDETGLATCSTECHMSGYWASLYGGRFGRNEPEEFVDDYFMDRLPGECTLGEYEFELDSSNQFVALLDFTSEDLVTPLDDNLLVQPVSFVYRTNPFKSEKRFFPVDFMYPFTYHNIVEITCANSALEVQPPPDTSFQITGATFVRQSSVENGVITIGFKMDIEQPIFRPGQYSKLREFFEKVARLGEDEVAILLEPEG